MTSAPYIIQNIRRGLLSLSLCALSLTTMGANTTEEVAQVSGTVTLTRAVDYVVTSATPFANGAVVDIANTDHAVLILTRVKPSVALGLLSHVRINGAPAVNNSNCMVKIYANGSIIMPHGTDIKPLTVYTGLDRTGTSETFAADYRRSLVNSSVNNKIRSFVLKRGYMATFATKADGKGYSRVFIADTEDRAVNLPPILDRAVSSIRVMPWNDVSKKGFAGRDNTINTTLNTTWCYNWDAGNDIYSDREFVTQRHHEAGIKNGKYEGAWPSVADCSNNGTSPHILGQNEPDNSSDPREVVTKVGDLLAIWPELMSTGKRLGSPAMAGNLNMLYQFLDSIDARGWRCDYVVMHTYWYSDWPSWQWNFNNVHKRTGRPIWITEMNYGANWTGWPAGDDRSGSPANLAIQRQHMVPILDGLEATPFIERYAYYNAVQDCRAAYLNNSLTPIGEYYAGIQSAMAYNSANEYIPRLPKSKGAPVDLTVKFDAKAGVAALAWYEPTGEYNKSMVVERRRGLGAWETVAEIELLEDGANYAFEDREAQSGDVYRVHTVYADEKDYYSKTVEAVPEMLAVGDIVEVNGVPMYLGGNVLPNGNFDFGAAGWTNGKGEPLAHPHFRVFPVGGYDGGSYLQAFSHGGADGVESVKTPVSLAPDATYYFSSATRFDGVAYNRLEFASNGSSSGTIAASIPNSTTWAKQASTFHTGSNDSAILTFRWLGSRAQFDQLSLSRLFATRDEAIADGIAAERKRAALLVRTNTTLPALNDVLNATAASATDAATLQHLTATINSTLEAMRLKGRADSCAAVAQAVLPEGFQGSDALRQALDDVQQAAGAREYISAVDGLKTALDNYLPFVDENKIATPNFAGGSYVGWTIKDGTYKDGTQSTATEAGKSAFTARWTGVSSTEGEQMTMAVSQEVKGLAHGLYVLEVKAAAQHYNLTDQHAYISTKTDSIVSPSLTADWLDLPTLADEAKWQTLTTKPVYLDENDTIRIGFAGSKKGAVDNAWREYANTSSTGDLREGSWSATDFVLRRVPVYHGVADASGWTTICLPYMAKPTPGVKFYQIAGKSADGSQIYLEEIYETAAGVPCIVHTDKERFVIQETGEAVTSTSYGANSLRGMLQTSARAPQYSVLLVNGVWVEQLESDRNKRPYLNDYQAFINRMSNVSVLQNWAGLSLPVTTSTGIHSMEAGNSSDVQYYTPDGRKVDSPNTPGLYIRVQAGKAVKIMK